MELESARQDALATLNLGLPTKLPCVFCNMSDEMKQILNECLYSFNLEHTGYENEHTMEASMLAWWQCVYGIYEHLEECQDIQWNLTILPYILVEKQKWLILYAAIALGCDFPIVEALAMHWPASPVSKRDIHDHLCFHKSHPNPGMPGYSTTNIIPWATRIPIWF